MYLLRSKNPTGTFVQNKDNTTAMTTAIAMRGATSDTKQIGSGGCDTDYDSNGQSEHDARPIAKMTRQRSIPDSDDSNESGFSELSLTHGVDGGQ